MPDLKDPPRSHSVLRSDFAGGSATPPSVGADGFMLILSQLSAKPLSTFAAGGCRIDGRREGDSTTQEALLDAPDVESADFKAVGELRRGAHCCAHSHDELVAKLAPRHPQFS
jgi:hypothetical protein